MDPYVEYRWQDLHPRLIVATCSAIQRLLGNDLIASIEERVVVEDSRGLKNRFGPDVRVVELPDSSGAGVAVADHVAIKPMHIEAIAAETVIERFIQIIDIKTNGRIITVIEFVSPSNKLPGESSKLYARKQDDGVTARINLVEIDLTRSGDRRLLCHRWSQTDIYPAAYQASRWKPAYGLTGADVYPMPLQSKLPVIGVPLREHEPEIALDLQTILDQCYVDARYNRTVNYSHPPIPPLAEPDASFARQLLGGIAHKPSY